MGPERPDGGAEVVVHPPPSWPEDRLRRLRAELAECADLAFAHLALVEVPSHGAGREPTLFVWLVPGVLRYLRGALNTVSAAVARALPDGVYVDVVVLNSAPELLLAVEESARLLVEREPAERSRAVAAARAGEDVGDPEEGSRRWWWPF